MPLVREKSGPAYERWLGKGGHLTLLKGGSAVHVVVRNHGDGRFANPILRCFDTMVDRFGKVTVFCDFERMPTYDTPLRTDLTEWCRERRASFEEFHLLAGSKIVMMGFTIANIALGGTIETHQERRSFELALRRSGW